jgi:predicted glycosyltransferase
MRILIDILHPAHAHFFKCFRKEMIDRGHEVLVTAREKDVAVPLLDSLGIPSEVLSRQGRGLGLGWEMIVRTSRLISYAFRHRPDVMTGIMGPSIAVAGQLLGIPTVVFYDTEFATQTNWFTYPLASAVCTPDCYQGRVHGNHITYPGYHELAYLHPNRFQPRPERLAPFGIRPEEPYSVVRFVSWEAIHDAREIALDFDQKRALVLALRSHGRVVITSEARLPSELEPMRSKGPVEDVHHLLAFARLMVGESATMASEAAVLGTPAVFIATTGRGYIDDQERRYGLVRHFKDAQFETALDWVKTCVASGMRKDDAQKARSELLRDKIDVTEWMVDFFTTRFAS